MKTDCLLIGYYDTDFTQYVSLVRSMGEDSGAYRDLNLAFIEYEGRPFRSMDILNHFHFQQSEGSYKPLHNYDFLWPTVSYLSTYLHRRGFTFDYINLPHLQRELFKRKLVEQDILSVAITTTLYVAPNPILELVRFIREHNAQTKIIVGGPYIYNQSKMLGEDQLKELFAYIGADVYVINQMGEAALVNVLSALKSGSSLAHIDNIAYRGSSLTARAAAVDSWRLSEQSNSAQSAIAAAGERERALSRARAWASAHPEQVAAVRKRREAGELRVNAVAAPYAVTKQSAEENPLEENRVDYSLFPLKDIGDSVSLWTAKSCPFACAFCGFPERAGKYVYLPVATIETELDKLKSLGVTDLAFLDDTFNVPKARFKEFLRMMIRNQYGFTWNSFYRGDQGDEETIDLMRQAGCGGVFLGVESGSDRVLEQMNKTARRDDYMKAIPLLRQAGILTHANFVIGFPGETEETVEETIDFIERTRPDTYRAQLWYCDPLTPVWARREEYGIQGSAFNWTHKTMDHRTAADMVDKLFLCIENSTWLPQHSFEQWSILYLQRRGMELDQIMKFVRCFNGAVKEKLRDGQSKSVPAELLAGMAEAARFTLRW